MKKINLKKKVVLALLAGGMLCTNSAFAEELNHWYGTTGNKWTVVDNDAVASGLTLTLDDCTVDVDGNSWITDGIVYFYAGHIYNGNATDNILTVTNTTCDGISLSAGDVGGTSGTSSNNKVYVSESTFAGMAMVSGASVVTSDSGTAEHNEAHLTNNSGTAYIVAAAGVTLDSTGSGSAEYNKLYVTNTDATVAAGAMSMMGTVNAKYNETYIKGGNFDTVCGAMVMAGTVSENLAEISEGNFAVSALGVVAGGHVVSGSGDVVKNKLTINNGSFNGGYKVTGGIGNENVNENEVIIKNGRVNSDDYLMVSGGINYNMGTPGTGAVNKNSLIIENGSFSFSGSANAYIAGGVNTQDSGGANYNTLTIKNGSFNGPIAVLGGYTEMGAAENNVLTIEGGSFSGGMMICGGVGLMGGAKDNIVNIVGGTFGNGIQYHGGLKVSGTSSNNTLNLKTVIGGTAAQVDFFQAMNFTIPAGVTSDAVMLKSATAVALSGVNVTVDLNGLSLTGNDYITLIQNVADAGFSETDHLKILDVAGTYCLVYTNGTPAVKADYTVKQGSTVKSEGTDASHEYANTIIKGRDTADGGMTSGYTITVRRGTYGSVTSGDPSRIYAVKSDSVDVCNNEIHIFDGNFLFNHFPDADNSIITGIVDTTGGGCDVYNNKVTIDGGEFIFAGGIEETTVQPVIAAGMADGATESDAHKVYGNIVEINDGYFKNTGTIVAGVARIGGTAHSDSVVGGTSLANGNKLIVNNMKFMGQYSLEGGVGIADNPLPVNYNTVEIKNVVFEGDGSTLQVVGGHGIGRTGASVSHNLVDVQGISSSTAMLVVSAAEAVGNSLPTSNDAINITVEGNKVNVANVDAPMLMVMGAAGGSNSVQDSGVDAPNVTMNIKNNEILVSKVNITNVAQIFGSMAGSTQISSDTYTGDFNHTISDNKLKITDSTFAMLVTVSGGEMVNPPEGGGTPGTMNISVSNNIFEMENCTVGSGSNQIMGASTMNGGANNNKLFITNSTIGDGSMVAGAQAMGGDANDNYIKISNSSFGDGAIIYGGYSEGGNASGNTVNITGGAFGGGAEIYGGYSGGDGTSVADRNTVEISGGSFGDGFLLYGGYDCAGTSSNNILNLKTKINGKASHVALFQTMNFTLPSEIVNGDTMLQTDLLQVNDNDKTATVNVYAAKGVKLNKDDVITLVDSDDTPDTFVGGDILGGAAEFYSEADAGEDKNGDGDQNDLIITLLQDFEQKKSAGNEDQQKAPVEGIAAAMQTVNMSADLASGEGMKSLIAETAGGVTNTFGALTAGQSKYKTGSHVDIDGWGLLVGAGKTKEWGNGEATSLGVFFEYGKGDFDTYNGNVHGDGNSKNQGIGIMMRHKMLNNTYYEGNIRYGKQSTEWSESEIGSYDTDSKYYGIMVGMGHIFPAGKNEIDVYGRYTFGHVGACDATVGDSHYNFESVKSHRVRLGAKYNFVQEKSNAKPFIGLAWEHEFKGESKASISGVGEAPAPSMKGNVGIMELGCDWDVSKKWTLGLGANAYIGKRKGWDGMARVFYNF